MNSRATGHMVYEVVKVGMSRDPMAVKTVPGDPASNSMLPIKAAVATGANINWSIAVLVTTALTDIGEFGMIFASRILFNRCTAGPWKTSPNRAIDIVLQMC